LLTDRLSRMLVLSVVIAVASAIGGYYAARLFNVNISGAMATITGVFFLAALIFAPERGLLARGIQRRNRSLRFAEEMLLVHLNRHENTADEETENTLKHLVDELNWTHDFAQGTVRRAAQHGYIERQNGSLHLTDTGRQIAHRALSR